MALLVRLRWFEGRCQVLVAKVFSLFTGLCHEALVKYTNVINAAKLIISAIHITPVRRQLASTRCSPGGTAKRIWPVGVAGALSVSRPSIVTCHPGK